MAKKTGGMGCLILIIIVIFVIYKCFNDEEDKESSPAIPVKPESSPTIPVEPESEPEIVVPTYPQEYLPIHKELAGFFSEIADYFKDGTKIAIDPFTLSNDQIVLFTEYLTKSANEYIFSQNSLIKTNNAQYFLRCVANPNDDKIVLRVRVVEVNTREIVEQFTYTLNNNNQIKNMLK
ncbi:MAG: hypothetical protein LBB61_06220 [Treponema sp.]|jgi:hypothetical protein|nr:hypothetical protein [Treponema sp.]